MMQNLRSVARRLSQSVAALVVVVVVASAAEAGPHRAKLSKDLEARIAAGDGATSGVIVSGSDAEVQALAARYGARVKKSIRGGAVLEVTGGQLAALSQDPDIAHLSGDARVQRMMAVTTQSTGATQVWEGAAGVRGFTGRGIGVAVIDSGVAQHSALRGHVVAAFDFTGRPSMAL